MSISLSVTLQFCLYFIFLLSSISYSQTDYIKWEKKDIDYSFRNSYLHETRDYSFRDKSLSGVIVKSAAILYWTIISDVDGDNCPFYPSCSSYFIEAVKETNLIAGTLLFFDRFTRDANPINKHKYYGRHKTGKFYDPVFPENNGDKTEW